MNIGLIGNGFVGTAIHQNLKSNYNFLIFDKKADKANCESVEYVVRNSGPVFVALPTPMDQNARCDLSIVFEAMSEIYKHYNNNIIILKSTVLPGTCQEIKNRFPHMRIVFSPEFLTEASHIEDFRDCNRMIFGGDPLDTAVCVKLVKLIFPDKHYVCTDWLTAEAVKYFINTFLATKVSFANEIKQVCDATGINYDEVTSLALLDTRIGQSHLKVPGPDGFYGFGGKCFAKDLNAFISFSAANNINPDVLKAVWKKNLEVRKEHDWLHIEGAVSKGETK